MMPRGRRSCRQRKQVYHRPTARPRCSPAMAAVTWCSGL